MNATMLNKSLLYQKGFVPFNCSVTEGNGNEYVKLVFFLKDRGLSLDETKQMDRIMDEYLEKNQDILLPVFLEYIHDYLKTIREVSPIVHVGFKNDNQTIHFMVLSRDTRKGFVPKQTLIHYTETRIEYADEVKIFTSKDSVTLLIENIAIYLYSSKGVFQRFDEALKKVNLSYLLEDYLEEIYHVSAADEIMVFDLDKEICLTDTPLSILDEKTLREINKKINKNIRRR